jgi:heme A synthase
MLHLFGVVVLLLSAGIALTQKKNKRFPYIIIGAVICWVVVVMQLTLNYF